MHKILFICHGNICRSPMAEFVMKDLVDRRGVAQRFHIESAATSNEEIGSPVHPGTRRRLSREGYRAKASVREGSCETITTTSMSSSAWMKPTSGI